MKPHRHQPRIYGSRRPVKVIVTSLLCALAAFVILYTILFFSLKRHIAFEDDRLYLDIPWLAEELEELREK